MKIFLQFNFVHNFKIRTYLKISRTIKIDFPIPIWMKKTFSWPSTDTKREIALSSVYGPHSDYRDGENWIPTKRARLLYGETQKINMASGEDKREMDCSFNSAKSPWKPVVAPFSWEIDKLESRCKKTAPF